MESIRLATSLFFHICWPVRIQLLCLCWIRYRLTSLVESKPVKQEVSCTMIQWYFPSWSKWVFSDYAFGHPIQCDQIGWIFALWAIIQSQWQQLFYPNCPHCWAIFVKLPKSFIFLVKSYFGQLLQTFCNFYLVTLTRSQK